MIQVTDAITIPEAELTWAYARSGGPGGQNVNKVESKALLRWAMAASPAVHPGVKDRIRTAHPSRVTVEGDLLVVSQRYRDQERNRQDCVDKLADLVRQALVPPKPRRATKPTWGSKQRRLSDKKKQGERKAGRRGPGDGE